MCLINLSFQHHPNYKLIVVANRDEAYARPTAAAHFWRDEPTILAGRDLLQMGSWLGITKQGRFAALTNFRDPSQSFEGSISRGEIVRNYLNEVISPVDFLHVLNEDKDLYDGFNVIVGDSNQLYYYSNIQSEIKEIPAGTHGLSNHLLNTPWPKVEKGKERLEEYCLANEVIEVNKLFDIHADEQIAEDKELPQTGIGLDLERKLSPLFIKTPNYGTRSTTAFMIDNNNHVTFSERTYEKGEFVKDNHFTFTIG